MIIIILSTMSGHTGLHVMANFVQKNRKELTLYFRPKNDTLPSLSTQERAL